MTASRFGIGNVQDKLRILELSGNSGTELNGLPLTKGEAIDEENTSNGLEDKYV